MSDQSKIPEEILENLRPYKQFKAVTCLKCGYSGHMGVKASVTPWYVSWWLFIVSILVLTAFSYFLPGPTPVVWGIIFAVARILVSKKLVVCPACNSEWQTKY